ncbi:MAG: PIN domain-containing protein [Nitrososphaeria archaeon]
MNEVVFDTNFVMALAVKPSRIIEEVNRLLDPVIYVVPSCVVEELKRLSTSSHVKKSKISSLALNIIMSHMKVVEMGREGTTDDVIVSYARCRDNVFVATLDSEMRRRLARENLRCITLSKDKVVLC